MPLRDHFRSPLDDVHAWDELHGMWPAMIVRELAQILPEPYFAAPSVHLGTLFEIDVGTYSEPLSDPWVIKEEEAPATSYTAPSPTLTLEPTLPQTDIYEVRIYDCRRNRRLVAAIELVSPPNKHSLESRATKRAAVPFASASQITSSAARKGCRRKFLFNRAALACSVNLDNFRRNNSTSTVAHSHWLAAIRYSALLLRSAVTRGTRYEPTLTTRLPLSLILIGSRQFATRISFFGPP
ncbi:MAG: hypothetical protein IT422_21580 [Pirellulaceae bacterium]|jgi:hypothetical protein|nr:hypothetical protein [Pirellulaceae bacterium]